MKSAGNLWQFRTSMLPASQGVDLAGFEVVGRDGPIGKVDETNHEVHVSYLIVDTGDWLPGRHVLLPAGTVERVDTSSRKVFLDRTKEEIRNAPDYDPAQKRSTNFQDSLAGYYHGLYDAGL